MQISFSVNNFSLFLCLQLLCLISPFFKPVCMCVRVREAGGVVSNLSCNMQYFHINFSFASFFHLPFPPSQITY